ncbi:MAG: hypothetical protein HQK92_00995 [Nitrospirae bacterium]|nr:hypothetical protein [Nitrospirota bacterium]
MKNLLLTSLVIIFVSLTSCGNGGDGSSGASSGSSSDSKSSSGSGSSASTNSAQTPVTITLGSGTTSSSLAKNFSTMSASIPSNITTITIKVSASDMTTIEQSVSVAGQSSVTTTLYVPNGSNRYFEVLALDSSSAVKYKGYTTSDLSGASVTLSISMKVSYTMADYYPLDDNDRWQYYRTRTTSVGTYTGYETNLVSGSETVNGVTGKKMYYDLLSGAGEYSVDSNGSTGFYRHKEHNLNTDSSGNNYYTDNVFSPPILFSLPYITESEQFSGTFTETSTVQSTGSSSTSTLTGRGQMQGLDNVTVAAGTFECLKFYYTFSNSDGHYGNLTWWYARGVGIVKKTENRYLSNGSVDIIKTNELNYASINGTTYGTRVLDNSSATVNILYNSQDGTYKLQFTVNSDYISRISSASVSGTNVTNLGLHYQSYGSRLYYSARQSFGSTSPTAGDVYTFTINHTDGTSETLRDTVYALGVGAPTLVSPTNNSTVTATPAFTWNAPATGCVSRYFIDVTDSSGQTVWGYLTPDATTTSITFNQDGTALYSLFTGGTYSWAVGANDDCNNQHNGTDNAAFSSKYSFTVR